MHDTNSTKPTVHALIDAIEAAADDRGDGRRERTALLTEIERREREAMASATIGERNACVAALEALAKTEDESKAAATNDTWRSMARSMAKAYRSGAAILRARGSR